MNNTPMKLSFVFDNEDYEVIGKKTSDYFQLPDGRVVQPDYYLESEPPQPRNLKVVNPPDNATLCPVEYKEKTFTFTYEDTEYVTTHRIQLVQYVELPNNKTLQIIIKNFANPNNPVEFIEASPLLDIKSENERENIIKAELVKPKNKLKM